jgi:hypothetical protein
MANTITWAVEWMNSSNETINGFKEVVLTAGWRATGTDTATPPNAATAYGSCSFPEPAEGDADFVAYANLTQEQVLGWCYKNGVVKDATEAALNSELSLLANPPVVQNPLPWADK